MLLTSMVCPSAGALAASSVPIVPPAPPRLSTTTGTPRASLSRCATMRPTISLPPPGGNGTMKRTGRLGYCCADTPAAPSDAPVNTAIATSLVPRMATCLSGEAVDCESRTVSGTLHDARSIARRCHPKFLNPRRFCERRRKIPRVLFPSRLDHHLVIETFQIDVAGVAHVGNGEPLLEEKGPDLTLAHAPFPGTANVQVGEEFTGHFRFDPAKHRQRAEREGRRHDERKVKTDAREYADRRRDPDRGGGSKPAHRQAFLENHAGAEEANAGHDSLCHARRIEGDAPGKFRWIPMPLVYRQQHQRARRNAYQGMGAKTSGAAMVAALETDQSAGGERGQQMLEYDLILTLHGRSVTNLQ